MELRDILKQYKEISVQMINDIKIDGEVEGSLEKREGLIQLLKTLSYSTEEFKAIAEEFDIMKIEKEAELELNKIRNSIKEEMLEIKKQRDATKGYGASFRNVNFIDEQI